MKMSSNFKAERVLAQHCDELTMRGPRPEERAEMLAAWRKDICSALSDRLGGLLGGGKLTVTLGEPEWLTGQQVFERIGPLAANSLLRCGGPEQTMLLSVDLGTTVALTDRSFGGPGEVPDGPFEQLTRSAGLLIDQVATIVAQGVAAASGEQDDGAGKVIVHRESVTRLKPFAPTASCAVFAMNIAEADGPSWQAILAATKEILDSLLPDMGDASEAEGKPKSPTDGRAASFGAIPMPIEAVLAQFDLTLGKLDRLAPGDCIPIVVPCEVPLQIGSQLLGRGSVGTLEDRMAIRLTSLGNGGSGQ